MFHHPTLWREMEPDISSRSCVSESYSWQYSVEGCLSGHRSSEVQDTKSLHAMKISLRPWLWREVNKPLICGTSATRHLALWGERGLGALTGEWWLHAGEQPRRGGRGGGGSSSTGFRFTSEKRKAKISTTNGGAGTNTIKHQILGGDQVSYHHPQICHNE